MQDRVQWFATITGITAAIIVSLNSGRKLTGYGFIVFTASSLAWVWFDWQAEETPLAVQNVVLTIINIIGIYRWLILQDRADVEKS